MEEIFIKQLHMPEKWNEALAMIAKLSRAPCKFLWNEIKICVIMRISIGMITKFRELE